MRKIQENKRSCLYENRDEREKNIALFFSQSYFFCLECVFSISLCVCSFVCISNKHVHDERIPINSTRLCVLRRANRPFIVWFEYFFFFLLLLSTKPFVYASILKLLSFCANRLLNYFLLLLLCCLIFQLNKMSIESLIVGQVQKIDSESSNLLNEAIEEKMMNNDTLTNAVFCDFENGHSIEELTHSSAFSGLGLGISVLLDRFRLPPQFLINLN